MSDEAKTAAGDGPTPAALQMLQDMVNLSAIPEDLAASYRAKYEELQAMVTNSIENERALLGKCQSLNEELLDTQKELSSSTQSASQHDAELDALSTTLSTNVVAQQELETLIDMTSMEKESVERSNAELQQEMVERRKKSESMMAPIVERLNAEIVTLNEEMESTQALLEKENQTKKEYTERIASCKEELLEMERVRLHKRQRLIRQKSEPERLEIQCSVIGRNLDILREKADDKKEKLQNIEAEAASIGVTRKSVDNERYGLAERLMRLRDAIDKKEREKEEITRRVEHAKLRISDAQQLRYELTIELNDKKQALKRTTDTMTKLSRTFEDTKRKFELFRRKRESVKQLMLPLEEEYDRQTKKHKDLKLELKRMAGVEETLKEDIDIFIASFLNAEDFELEKKAMLKTKRDTMAQRQLGIAAQKAEERLLRERLRELSLLREQLMKDTSRVCAEMHAQRQQMKVKEIECMDLSKKSLSKVQNLKECRKQYEAMKNSRNRYANLVQNTYQALSEMKEKIKIVENELEILKNENVSKETALIEESRILTAAQYTRDQLRFELNKSQHIWADKRAEIQRYEMDIAKLEITVRSIDAEVEGIAQKFEAALVHRNRNGLLVIDRNDELSLLCEKKNVLRSVLAQGDALIREKDAHSKTLKLAIEDVRRSLEVQRQRLPSDEQQRECAKTYCALETRLKETRRVSKQLSQELAVPNPSLNPTRYRKIAGSDPSANQLHSQIAVLSSRLTTQKEQLLEKELILEEVDGLTLKLRLQAVEGHEITLLLAKKINSLQYTIKRVTRSMMATVSELSMYQATSLKLEHQKESLHTQIEQGQTLLSQRLAPFDEAEREWAHHEQRRLRQIHQDQRSTRPSSNRGLGVNHRDWTPSYDYTDDAKQKDASGERMVSSANSKTTAEPRPKAYVADDIGIPKPYGAHAPFKPTPLGSNLRHIKKPKQRQVII